MSNRSRAVLAFAAAIVPSIALADGAPGALDAIRQIFGVDPTSFWTMLSGTSQPTLLANISGVINSAALTVAVAVMVVTGVTGVMQSAHEGTNVLGQRYSALWVPIRWVVGIGMLLPLPGGYSALQCAVLGFASIGSGLADQAWAMSSDAVGQSTNVVIAQSAPNNRRLINGMYASAVCASRLNQVGDQSGQTGSVVQAQPYALQSWVPTSTYQFSATSSGSGFTGYYQATPGGQGLAGGVSFDGQGELGSVRGLCGQAVISTSGDQITTAQTQYANLLQLQEAVQQVADDAVNQNLDTNTVQRRLAVIETWYQGAEQSRVNALVAASPSPASLLSANASGSGAWVTAGAYYMSMAGLNSSISAAAGQEPSYKAPRLDQLPPALQTDLEPYLAKAARQSAGEGGGEAPAGGSPPPPQLSGGEQVANFLINYSPVGQVYSAGSGANLTDGIAKYGPSMETLKALNDDPLATIRALSIKYFDGWFKSIRNAMIDPSSDPLIALQALGHKGIWACEAAYPVVLLIASLAGVVSSVGGQIIWAAGTFVIGPVFIACITFAFLLPAIPYVLWMFGVLGWLVMLVEAVAVAPLWAASHVLPEGEGWAGNRAHQGYDMLIGLVARPVLMIVGLAASMLIMRVTMLLVSTSFFTFMDVALGDYTRGIVTMLTMLILYMVLTVTVIRKSFSLIHIIPDQALTWIGHGVRSLGEMSAAAELEQGALGAYAALRRGTGTRDRIGSWIGSRGKGDGPGPARLSKA